jgi:hypothetical protein
MNAFSPTGLNLRSEDALLLACATTKLEKGRSEQIRSLAGECKDWDYVLQAAQRHGITALVSSNLDEAAPDVAPAATLEQMRQRFRSNAARNLFLMQELVSIMRELGAAGISVMPFKGPILALTAYGNVALRQFIDLDILVQKEHLQRAGEILVKRGYKPIACQAGQQQTVQIEAQLGCDFVREDIRTSVELHWSFIQVWLGFKIDLDSLWNAPDRVNVGGLSVRRMPAETELLYLCAHGTKHQWKRLSWVVDIAEQLRSQPDRDWDHLLTEALSGGCRRTLFLGLHLAHALLGADIPQKVQAQIKRDESVSELAQQVYGLLFSFGSAGQQWSNDKFHIRAKERWTDRLVYLRFLLKWTMSPSKKDKEWISLPESLGWLYVFLRPVRIACSAVRPSTRGGVRAPSP